MTMHMIKGVHAATTRKQKPKMTKANTAKWREALVQHNRELKQLGEKPISFGQYVNLIHGIGHKRNQDHEPTTYKPDYGYQRGRTDHLRSYSGPLRGSKCTKSQSTPYTGDLVKGIAQTHKSNAVPVINHEEIVAIAHMRR